MGSDKTTEDGLRLAIFLGTMRTIAPLLCSIAFWYQGTSSEYGKEEHIKKLGRD